MMKEFFNSHFAFGEKSVPQHFPRNSYSVSKGQSVDIAVHPILFFTILVGPVFK